MNKKVYIVNKSNHDFSKAGEFGQLIYCTSGRMDRLATNDMARKLTDAMRNSEAGDLILLCSLNVLNAIACSIFVAKHGRLNLLLYLGRNGEYIERNLVFEK